LTGESMRHNGHADLLREATCVIVLSRPTLTASCKTKRSSFGAPQTRIKTEPSGTKFAGTFGFPGEQEVSIEPGAVDLDEDESKYHCA